VTELNQMSNQLCWSWTRTARGWHYHCQPRFTRR